MALTKQQLMALRYIPVPPSGNRLAAARLLLGKSQIAMAAETGFRNTYISEVEHGRYGDISLINARRLADYLGCAIEDVFPPKKKKAVAA